jgi:hypothetical protein
MVERKFVPLGGVEPVRTDSLSRSLTPWIEAQVSRGYFSIAYWYPLVFLSRQWRYFPCTILSASEPDETRTEIPSQMQCQLFDGSSEPRSRNSRSSIRKSREAFAVAGGQDRRLKILISVLTSTVSRSTSTAGQATHNAVIEASNGSLRTERPNPQWFLTLDDARSKMED